MAVPGSAPPSPASSDVAACGVAAAPFRGAERSRAGGRGRRGRRRGLGGGCRTWTAGAWAQPVPVPVALWSAACCPVGRSVAVDGVRGARTDRPSRSCPPRRRSAVAPRDVGAVPGVVVLVVALVRERVGAGRACPRSLRGALAVPVDGHLPACVRICELRLRRRVVLLRGLAAAEVGARSYRLRFVGVGGCAAPPSGRRVRASCEPASAAAAPCPTRGPRPVRRGRRTARSAVPARGAAPGLGWPYRSAAGRVRIGALLSVRGPGCGARPCPGLLLPNGVATVRWTRGRARRGCGAGRGEAPAGLAGSSVAACSRRVGPSPGAASGPRRHVAVARARPAARPALDDAILRRQLHEGGRLGVVVTPCGLRPP